MSLRTIAQAVMPDSTGDTPDPNERPPVNIERIAIENRGVIGSQYNGYGDNITGKVAVRDKFQSTEVINNIRCLQVKGRTAHSQNLLKFIDIDDQLRLSIALNMVPATGIASLIYYPRQIDKHTRLFYVCHESYIKLCKDKLHELKKPIITSTSDIHGTHVITGIIYGIHLLVILQLPVDHEGAIDVLLLKLEDSLQNSTSSLRLTAEDKTLLEKIDSTTVYSNISDLTKNKNFQNVYEKLQKLQKKNDKHLPLKYILTPVSWFYGQHGTHVQTLSVCKPNETESLEHYLLQRLSELKVLNLRVNHNLPDLLQENLRKQLNDIQHTFLQIQELHAEETRQISLKLSKIRQGKGSFDSIDLYSQTTIPPLIQRLITSLDELESKGRFIQGLQKKGFKYCNVVDMEIKQGIGDQTINTILLDKDTYKAVFCATDVFRTYHDDAWKKMCSEMINESENNPKLNLVYADFTYSTYTLKKMTILTSKDITPVNDQPSGSDTDRHSSPPPPSPTDDCINILLLGESGVGKSTFINAFANYLHFSSLDDAHQGEPVVVIPVSFLMTINDNFDEKIIKFGEVDSNENHNNFGQSVTQQCKSYVFNISHGRRLRIIDTPGFGDTRGSDQDNLNMDEIFSCLNNLSYLNGICLLFKPEVIQLNPYFRSCCTQLFDYFGENIRNQLIFCFTNARSTFFAPGNTRPLLKTFFESFPVRNIPFDKRNTFCFDSESFRYLIAIQNAVQFKQDDRKEFEQSWLRSVTESKRFRSYLLAQPLYRKNNEWQSTKEVQSQINTMIRPMLETMRHLLRNIRLYDQNLSIKLRAVHVEPLTTICYASHRTPEKFGSFWIFPDHLHHAMNTCVSHDQKPAEYRLHYELHHKHSIEPLSDLKKQLRCVGETSAKFSSFLRRNCELQPDDRFLDGIKRMINEERSICQTKTSCELNKTLVDQLKQLRATYEGYLDDIAASGKDFTVSAVCDLIELVHQIPLVKIQMDAVRKYHQDLLAKNERIVHTNRCCHD